jgi:hypothetical protein
MLLNNKDYYKRLQEVFAKHPDFYHVAIENVSARRFAL